MPLLNENHPTSSNLPSSPSLEGFGNWEFGDLGTEFFCLATLKNGKSIEVGFCMRRFLDDADDDDDDEQHDADDGEL